MPNNQVSPALPMAVDEWTTYFVQHLQPEISFFDEIYIVESERSESASMETVNIPEMFHYLKQKIFFHCHVVQSGTETVLSINLDSNETILSGTRIPISQYCVIGCVAKYETLHDSTKSLRMRIVIVDWYNRSTSYVEHVFPQRSVKPIEIICSRMRSFNTLMKPISVSSENDKPFSASQVVRPVVPVVMDSPLFEM